MGAEEGGRRGGAVVFECEEGPGGGTGDVVPREEGGGLRGIDGRGAEERTGRFCYGFLSVWVS